MVSRAYGGAFAAIIVGSAAIACGSSSHAFDDTTDSGTGSAQNDSGGATDDGGKTTGSDTGAATDSGADGSIPASDTLDSNRDRLIGSYLTYLKTSVTTPQSNGLSGSNVTDACQLWKKLDPSTQAVFLTLTARLQGSTVADDGHSMLDHIVKIYRMTGGQNATASDPGSCGGGEYNRMIMQMDAHLHDALVAANTDKGQVNAKGQIDIADIPTNGANSFWRDSHDLGGPHAPYDLSDETDIGAPRGQVQYFKDPTSTLANTALGRVDLMTLVDPLSIEMDQDYDCPHNSNPSCSYTTYGPSCLPETSLLGTAIYTQDYGSFEPGWLPAACGVSQTTDN